MNFTPLHDMILVKPDPVPEKIGSIHVPQGAIKASDQPGNFHDTGIGSVVAIGLGDKRKQFETTCCPDCHVIWEFDPGLDVYLCDCEGRWVASAVAEEWNRSRHPMLVQVGDRVVFPRRPSSPGGEFSVKIDGEMYMMFNEEQSALAVIDPE